jgi:hypothetical protein
MPEEVLRMHKGESFALGLMVGVIVAMSVMWFPLQSISNDNRERITNIEKRVFKNAN